MQKKRAFTMVELIFVIVILGILAAVAVPRLNASREDAIVKTAVANVRILLGDILSYYAAQESIPKDFDLRKLTNVELVLAGDNYEFNVLGLSCFYVTTKFGDDRVVFGAHIDGVKSRPIACQRVFGELDFVRGLDLDTNGTVYPNNGVVGFASAPDHNRWRHVQLQLGGSVEF